MKLQHKKLTRKRIIITSIIAALVLGGSAYAYYAVRHNPTNTTANPSSKTSTPANQKVDKSPATSDQVQAGNDAKLNTVQQQQDTTPTPASFTVTITAANQTNSTIAIRALISGAVSQSGTCSIKITNGSASTSATAPTQALADSSTCQGFNFSSSQLGAGTWDITLTVTIDGQSQTATKSMSVH